MRKKILKSYLNLATLLFLPKVPHPIILIIIIYISCEKENVVLSKIWYIRQLFFGDENNFNKCTSSNCCIAQSKSTLNEYKNDISKWRVGGNYVCT